MFNTKFQARVYKNHQLIHSFNFQVTHSSIYDAGQAAADYLNSMNEQPGEVAFNYGFTSGNIYTDDGHVCYFEEVENRSR